MHHTDIDGVPVLTAPGGDRTTAALVFGVGLRDETFAAIEVTHLVEHLAMSALPKSHLRCNAVTDVDTTTFFATGRPAAVGAFLEGVCRALADLPTDRIDVEIGVLEAENCSTADSTLGALWAARFGLAGPGLVVADGPGREFLTEDVVRAHARRWFVRGNAALWCRGPLPEGLRLPLPDGPPPGRTTPQPRPQTGPVWTVVPGAGVGLLLGATGPWDPALRLGVEVLLDRLRDTARHTRGISYSVDSVGLDLHAGHREVAVVVDARQGQEAAVADLVWQQLVALGDAGPTPGELAHAVAGFEEELDADEQAVVEAELADAAYCTVAGLPFRPVHDVVRAWRATTPADVAAALRRARTTAVLAVPEGVRYPGPGAPVEHRALCTLESVVPDGETFRPPLLTRLLRPVDRRTLVVGDTVLAHQDADGDVHRVPWELLECAVPTEDGRGVLVVGRNLCTVRVHEAVFGRRAVAVVRARVPADRWVHRPVARTEDLVAAS
ncbi:hypothetical protein [Geodermatophilus sp. CPCC 205761]|uniref:hypothetical protein n=1 Tax=Geodermatophilus sp. CPCC 205761 TaxID=2936597 RepID=UPI003EE84793